MEAAAKQTKQGINALSKNHRQQLIGLLALVIINLAIIVTWAVFSNGWKQGEGIRNDLERFCESKEMTYKKHFFLNSDVMAVECYGTEADGRLKTETYAKPRQEWNGAAST